MFRTRTRNTGKAGNETSSMGSEGAAPISEVAGEGLTEEKLSTVVRMMENANQGDASIMVTLGASAKPNPVGNEAAADRIGFSQALAWKAEPEWQDQSSEEKAETASGSREPENELSYA
jgi:hypothetical protein